MRQVTKKPSTEGREPETGVILSLDEFDELRDGYRELLDRKEKAEKDCRDAEDRINDLSNSKNEKEKELSELQGKRDELKVTVENLNARFDREKHLFKTLIALQEGGK